MRRFALALVCVVLVACGKPAPVANESPAVPTAAATPTPRELYGVLRTGGQGEVDIVDRKGTLVAKAPATFFQAKNYLNAANLLQFRLPAATSSGGVYWLDPQGGVHELDSKGTVTDITSFSFGANQQGVFAVSPRGDELMASVITLAPGPAQCQPLCRQVPSTLTTYFARPLQPATVVATTDLSASGATVVSGWTANGPVATLGSTLNRQDAPVSARLLGHPLIHLGSDGSHLGALGGADCVPLDVLVDDTVLCGDYNIPWQVRDASGHVLWDTGPAAGFNPLLAPDGRHVVTTSTVLSADRPAASLPRTALGAGATPGFQAQGWVDASTMVGTENGELGLLPISNLNAFESWRLTSAAYVGPIGR